MCQWVPASTGVRLMAARFQQPLAANTATVSAGDATMPGNTDRAPIRVLRDTYPTYSAVALDLNTNEVFLQDENLFGIRVFNRTDNTPPTANFTEPKRVLGGLKTKLEFNCAIYIDPHTGDIYSVPNDTVDTLMIFPREAQRDVAQNAGRP